MIATLRPSVIVFDVNETLIDITTLEPLFARIFGDAGVMREWFAQLILYSEAITLSGTYVPFGELAAGVFRMTGEIHQMKVSEADIAELHWLLQCMPPHFGVTEALIRLKEAGFRLVTLTNSPPSPGSGPLDQAGLAEHFEQMFSVDTVRRFKPASEVYRMVADALEVELADLCLVAAHAWDTLGAQAVGCAGAMVSLPGNAVLHVPGLPEPDIVAPDIPSVANEIIRRWGRHPQEVLQADEGRDLAPVQPVTPQKRG